MKTIILAGGLGTRISEKTDVMPKPMVEIGGKPLLWHLMHIYASFGHEEFLLALGYKGEMIKEYFYNFYALNNDLTIDLKTGKSTIHSGFQPNWKVHLIGTGQKTETGGRLKRLQKWIGNETFMMTYGDGLSSIDLDALLAFHKSHGRLATVTAVYPPTRFGGLSLNGSDVTHFLEKPVKGEGLVNGGFFVLEPEVFSYIEGDDVIFERDPVERLAKEGELKAYVHEGFWQPMDTLREQRLLEDMWKSGKAPWRNLTKAL